MNKESKKQNVMSLLKNQENVYEILSLKTRNKNNLNDNQSFLNKTSNDIKASNQILVGETITNMESAKIENNLIVSGKEKRKNNLINSSTSNKLSLSNKNRNSLLKESLQNHNKSVIINAYALNKIKSDLNSYEKYQHNESLDTNREIEDNNKNINVENQNQKYEECFFCEKLFTDTEFFENFKCQHFFCRECGQEFYRNLINQGQIKNYKCPIFSCKANFSKQFIKSLTAVKFYELKKVDYKKNKNNKSTSIRRNISLKVLDSKSLFIQNEEFLKENVIDINNTTSNDKILILIIIFYTLYIILIINKL